MDDQTMIELFESLKREIKSFSGWMREELQPIRESLERIEARQISDEAEILRIISGEYLR
jgi:hypothetical protein